MINSGDRVELNIGRDEALVLFEMLADFYGQACLPIKSPVEKLALVRLQGSLERAMVEPFLPEYRTLVDEARSHLARDSGPL